MNEIIKFSDVASAIMLKSPEAGFEPNIMAALKINHTTRKIKTILTRTHTRHG